VLVTPWPEHCPESAAEARLTAKPLLVIGLGNPSRGDDALGPALVEALRASAASEWQAGVEWLVDYQLQIEHALDLDGRAAVLVVDAARPGHTGSPEGVDLAALEAEVAPRTWTTHALLPSALLGIYERVQGRRAPPTWLLAIEGEAFELGAPMSDAASRRLDVATERALGWLAARKAATHTALSNVSLSS